MDCSGLCDKLVLARQGAAGGRADCELAKMDWGRRIRWWVLSLTLKTPEACGLGGLRARMVVVVVVIISSILILLIVLNILVVVVVVVTIISHETASSRNNDEMSTAIDLASTERNKARTDST